LQSIDLFKGLSGPDLNTLARTVSLHRYEAGQIIFKQGDIGTTMYIVVKGHVNIFMPGEASRLISLKDLTQGEYFGELALVDDKPRSASARAVTDVDLLELTRDMLLTYIGLQPRAALAILHTMSERLRETNILLSQRTSKNVDEEIERSLTWSDRIADKVAELNGSWAFIIILLGSTVTWMIVNSLHLLGNPFDPYPYVFFNLILAVLVALQGPLIVMSQNREGLRDRARAEADYKVNLKNEVTIEMILQEVQALRNEMEERLRQTEPQLKSQGEISSKDASAKEVFKDLLSKPFQGETDL